MCGTYYKFNMKNFEKINLKKVFNLLHSKLQARMNLNQVFNPIQFKVRIIIIGTFGLFQIDL